jgi:hypothetical protein
MISRGVTLAVVVCLRGRGSVPRVFVTRQPKTSELGIIKLDANLSL